METLGTTYVVLITAVVVLGALAKIVMEVRGSLDQLPRAVKIEELVMTLYSLLGAYMVCLVWFNIAHLDPILRICYVALTLVYLLSSFWLPRFKWIASKTSMYSSALLCILNTLLAMPILYIIAANARGGA